jgi:cobalt-zinc-cadmium resistance protein CzcA
VRFDPAANTVVWSGKFENQQRAQARLAVIVGVVLSLMLFILYAGFGRMRNAALILSVVPLAALGGLIALHLTGETLNVATGVGFLALFGVAVRNGIITVAHLNRLTAVHVASARPRRAGVANESIENHGAEVSALRDGALDGAVERFRSVLTTAVPAVGMRPAALATALAATCSAALARSLSAG